MGMTTTRWEEDEEFTTWLKTEGLRISGDEIETRMCGLLWEAWKAGRRQGEFDEKHRQSCCRWRPSDDTI